MQLILGCFFFLLGAVLASFTGVISERVYTGQSWLQGRSRCNSCRRTLSTPDLIPIFSWIAFRGRCRTCRARVPGSYALTEAILGIIFVLSFLKLGLTLSLCIAAKKAHADTYIEKFPLQQELCYSKCES
jgi:prepilin signal peptidase PulO-like enzyme (type II secretory pathway)